MDTFLCVCMITLMFLTLVVTIVNDVKKQRRAAPYGKVFKKDFYDKVEDISRAQLNEKAKSLQVRMSNGHTFTVRVADSYDRVGLEYSTIPYHICYSLFVNDEHVCKVHKLKVDCNYVYSVEFSSKRQYKEIIEIVDTAYSYAKKTLDAKYYARWKENNNVSFYE